MRNRIASSVGETYTVTDSQRHKDYRDIFAMACAEVTTPDKLFQIIARRLNYAKDEASADVRVGQHKFVTYSVMASA